MATSEVSDANIEYEGVQIFASDLLDELHGWAGLFGRRVYDEIRIAVDIHVLKLALSVLDDEHERQRMIDEGADVESIRDRIQDRLSKAGAVAYTRPSLVGLVVSAQTRSATDPAGFPGFWFSREAKADGKGA